MIPEIVLLIAFVGAVLVTVLGPRILFDYRATNEGIEFFTLRSVVFARLSARDIVEARPITYTQAMRFWIPAFFFGLWLTNRFGPLVLVGRQ